MGKSLRGQEKRGLLLALGHKGWRKALMWGKGTPCPGAGDMAGEYWDQ